MDAETLDRIAYQQQLGMSSVTRLDRVSYQRYLVVLRDLVVREHAILAAEGERGDATDAVLISALPMLWEDAGTE